MAPQASSRMLKKSVQQGRSKRSGDAYSVRYGEPLSEARTPLADFFNTLLEVRSSTSHHQQIGCCTNNGLDSEQDLYFLRAYNLITSATDSMSS